MKIKLLQQLFNMSKFTLYGMVLQCCFLTALFANEGNAQKYRSVKEVYVTINFDNDDLRSAFRKIEAITEIHFAFNKEDVEKDIRFDKAYKNQTVYEVLLDISRKARLMFRQVNHVINVSAIPKQKEKQEERVEINLQSFTVSGNVKDNNNESLPGVNVVVKGTTIGTVTDVDGNYSIDVPNGNVTLIFSFIGYVSEEVSVNDRTVINLIMTPDVETLQEVVIVGYGTQKKINLTGSVETLNGEEIAKQPITQASQALLGKMAGVTVNPSSGQPGSDAATIRIRGIGTIGDVNPLVLIDGIPGNMNGVDPRNIATISVLKDAAAASIYGSRAANGVILITTKRGESGELKVNYSGYMGWQEPTTHPKFVGGGEFMRMYNLARENLGQSPAFSQQHIDAWRQNHLTDPDQYPNTDWVKELFTENGFQQYHSINVSGGNKMIKVMGSLSFLDQGGNIPNFHYKRYNTRINTDIVASDKIDFNLDFSWRNSVRDQPGSGLTAYTGQAYRIPPIYAARFTNGTWGPGWNGNNPVARAIDGGNNEDQYNNVRAVIRANYKPLSGVKFSLMYSPEYNYNYGKHFTRQYEYYEYGAVRPELYPAKNSLLQGSNRTLHNTLNAIGSYEKTFGNHGLKGLAGYELITYRNDWFNASRDNFPLQDYEQLSAGSLENRDNNGSASEWALQSYFARVNYNYNEKYLLEANVRIDGSSRFAKGYKYGAFPAFSAGWRVSEEPFLSEIDFITDLKLRASWGQLGNQEIGTYPAVSTISLGQDFLFDDMTPVGGAAQTALANKEISWETTETTNFGIDLGMFNNRLTISAEYYVRNTYDILLELPIPTPVGLSSPYQNAGKVRNEGWDLALGWRDRINEFNYGINFNISDFKNEVVDLVETGPHISGNSITKEGHPINAIYGYESDGFFQTRDEVDEALPQFGAIAPGDIRYVNQLTEDTDDDGVPDTADDVINADDRVILGSHFPRLSFGMNLTANFKGFDLSVFFQGVGNRDVLLRRDAVWAFYNAGKMQEWHRDYWTPDNPDASYPRLVATTNHNNFETSDFWVFDASYLRLRNVSIGYTFPENLINNIFVDRLRIYFSGQNLLTFDDMPEGWDPEIPNGSVGYIYPITRVMTMGVDITF